MNISHQLLDYTINVCSKYFWYTKLNQTQILYDDFNQYALKAKNPPHLSHNKNF